MMASVLGPLRIFLVLLLAALACALLWKPQRREPSRLWLGLLLLVNTGLVLTGIVRASGHLAPTEAPVSFSLVFAAFALSPLCLYRAIASYQAPRRWSLRDARTFLPAGVLAAVLIAASLLVAPRGAVFAMRATWVYALIGLHGIALGAFAASVRQVRQAPVWLQVLFGVFVVHWGFSGGAGLVGLMGWPGGAALEVCSLGALLLFGLGAAAAGVQQMGTRLPRVATYDEVASPALADPADAALSERLRTLFESEKVYLDADLTLDRLADHAGAAPREVSRVLNTILGGGYHEVVRRYRVRRAQQLLRQDPEATVLAVLYESGFSSKSAFHRAFRSQVGMTPSAYRENGDEDAAGRSRSGGQQVAS